MTQNNLNLPDKPGSSPCVASRDLFCVEVGDTVQRGDLFLDADGRYHEMDKFGRITGVRCLGSLIRKTGAWFRPQNVEGRHR